MPSILHTVRDLGRLREIVAVLARHGFGELVQRTGLGGLAPKRPDGSAQASTAERIRLVLEELGPSFVKLGQIASTRPDLLPREVVDELKRLQDDVPPVPFEQMKAELEQQLGAPIADLFSRLEETPIASASIGQVYRARLRLPAQEAGADDDGVATEADVVVKVQRPNIASTIERDMDLLYWLAHAIERSIPEASLYSPVKLVGEFDRAVSAELDFTLEADNAERFAQNFEDLSTVVFPRVYRRASSRKVITLSYIPGDKVFAAVARGASGELIAKNAIQVMVRMIFEHGFFHADPHPGNILIAGEPDKPVIGLVDLGLVGRLGPKLRDRLVDLMVAIGREDSRAMADALYAIGRPTKQIDRTAFESEVARLSDKYLRKQLGQIEFAELIRDLAGGALRYGVEVPPDFLMVGKALMTVEGIGRQIFPQLDLAQEVKPYFAQIIGYRYSPERITNDLIHLATRLSTAATEFPARADDILEDLRQGRLSLEIRQPSALHAYERLGRRLFAAVVIGASVIGAAVLVSAGHAIAGWSLLGGAAVWTFLHSAALALTGKRPPR